VSAIKVPVALVSLILSAVCLQTALASDSYNMEDNAFLHFQQGQQWMEWQEYEAAIREFQIGIRLKPSTGMTAALYNNMGLAYQKIRQFPKAIVSFQKALTMNPNFSLYYENLVKAYQESGATQSAIQNLQQATQQQPDAPSAWYLLGLLYETQGDKHSAQQAFQAYLDIAPNSDLAFAAKSRLP
jgi:tetratricopeptide (TPR) repeat protein